MYLIFTKKKLLALFCAVVLAVVILGQVFTVKAGDTSLFTNAQRVDYIKTLGLELVGDNFCEKQAVIPLEFSQVYQKYNDLQKSAGFNLWNYRNKKVTIYTYSLTNEWVVNLIIYKNKLIGGDIAQTKLGGNMLPLEENKNGKGTL